MTQRKTARTSEPDAENAKTALLTMVLFTPEQTAKILGVSAGTLNIWRCLRRYKLRYVRVGNRVRYRAQDIEQFLRERTVSPEPRRAQKTA